ncbi:MAG: 1-acyl-sn-glycerol-3-phosphate acyltransferase [Treponema sp.]|nr:1-acyl-sn-glycerol-3-phosphate acyltransferase [Candidatus Treponema caballi]
MTFLGALIRTANYLLSKQKYKRQCLRLQKNGQIEERNALVNVHVPDWARYMVNLMGCKKSEVTVIGQENIPQDTAVVFIGNHQSYLDIPVMLGYSGKNLAFIAKAEILKVPVLSAWMKLMECVFMVRESPRQSVQAMNTAVENVKKGYSMMIFPEGHRSRSDEIKAFHPGSFKLAFRSEVPIIPVTIDGTWHLFEEKKRPQAAPITLTFHEPIPTAGLTREQQAAIPEKVFEIIKADLPLYKNGGQ